MKTSNYIIIAFFTFLFGGIFVLFLSSTFKIGKVPDQNFLAQEKVLDNFSVVVAQPGANLYLKTGTIPKISKHYLKGDTCSLPPFIVRNDTLFVGANPVGDKQLSSEIIYKQITGIEGGEKSRIEIDQFAADTFNITVHTGKVYCFAGKFKNINKKVNIQATKQAYIQIHNLNIQSIQIGLDNSELNFQNTTIQNLTGVLKDRSKLQSYHAINKLELEVDSTSTYRLDK